MANFTQGRNRLILHFFCNLFCFAVKKRILKKSVILRASKSTNNLEHIQTKPLTAHDLTNRRTATIPNMAVLIWWLVPVTQKTKSQIV